MVDMNSEQLWSEVQEYIVNSPLISNQPGIQPDGNPILYMGLFVSVWTLYFEPTVELTSLVEATYKDALIVPGLINRGHHKKPDKQEHDDYIGLAAASYLSTHIYASMQIYDYGRRNGWKFDNTGRGTTFFKSLSVWHARMPGVVQHYKLCAGRGWNTFDKIWWSLGLIKISDKNNVSGLQLDWLMVRVYEKSNRSYFITNLAVRQWKKAIAKKYPDKMGSIFEIYFGPGHILTKWARGRM